VPEGIDEADPCPAGVALEAEEPFASALGSSGAGGDVQYLLTGSQQQRWETGLPTLQPPVVWNLELVILISHAPQVDIVIYTC
jgi:hypothetical protein